MRSICLLALLLTCGGACAQLNIALGTPAQATSQFDANWPASEAVDGVVGDQGWHSAIGDSSPEWWTDFGGLYAIDSIRVTKRLNDASTYLPRFTGVQVAVYTNSEATGTAVWSETLATATTNDGVGYGETFTFPAAITGRSVRLIGPSDDGLINVSEVFVYNDSYGGTNTWTGGGSNANWSTAANWTNGVVPMEFADLVFSGATQQVTTNDLLTQVNSITFDTGGWTLRGNPIALGGNIQRTGGNTIDLDMKMKAALAFNGVNNLTVNGAITGPDGGGTLSLNGGSTITLNGVIADGSNGALHVYAYTDGCNYKLMATNNTFTGNVQIGANRSLTVTKLADGGQPSSIGAGTGPIIFSYRAGFQNTHLYYVGEDDSSTDRGINAASYYSGNAKYIHNNSPSNAALAFTSTSAFQWSVAYDSVNRLELQGTSTATNLFAMRLGDYTTTKRLQLNVRGNGTWEISHTNNTHTGGTVVSDSARLWLSGNLLATNAVTINSGAALGGSGMIAGPATLTGTAPRIDMRSGAVETLTLTNGLTLAAGSVLSAEIGHDAGDQVAVTGGTLQLSSNVTVNVELLGDPESTRIAIPFMPSENLVDAHLVSTWTCLNDLYDFTAIVLGNTVWLQRPPPGSVLVIR